MLTEFTMPNRAIADSYHRVELLRGLAMALREVDYSTMSDADLLALTVFLQGRCPVINTVREFERRGLHIV